LKKVQQAPDSREALERISALTVADLRALNFEIPTKIHEDIFDSGIVMLEHEVPSTNGIAYVDFSIDISNMDFDDVVLLPLFCQMLINAGNNRQDGFEMQRDIDAQSGGITVEPLVDEIVHSAGDGGYVVPNGQYMITKVVVRASCLAETGCLPMFTLIKQILFEADVEKQSVVIDILKKMIDDMEDDIQVNAQDYSTYRVQSQYGLPGFIREQWKGLTQLLNMRRALIQAQSDWSTLSMRLVLMADAMRRGNRNGMALSLTGDKEAIKGIAPGLQLFARDVLPGAAQVTRFPDFAKVVHPWHTKGSRRWTDEVNAEGESEAFIVPSRLSAVAKGGLLFDIGEPIRGSDLVVLQYIGGYFLYNELRFGQGADSARATVDIDTGSVVYQSNQDPNIALTLDIYDQGASFVLREVGGKSSLPPEAEGAVIGAVGQLDGTAMQPSEIGYTSLVQYLRQESTANRQKFREEITGATVADFLSMADRLGGWGKPSIAVVTNQEEYDRAIAEGITLRLCDTTGVSC
jgi:Zn-dependent M16 (insulinase) family peptidase